LKSSREGECRGHSTGRKIRRVDMSVFSGGILKAGTDDGVSSRRSVNFFVNHWISQASGEIKAECFSTLISLGGIEAVGFRSMRVIDLTSLKFAISEFEKWRRL
jgi:hypothetical protein